MHGNAACCAPDWAQSGLAGARRLTCHSLVPKALASSPPALPHTSRGDLQAPSAPPHEPRHRPAYQPRWRLRRVAGGAWEARKRAHDQHRFARGLCGRARAPPGPATRPGSLPAPGGPAAARPRAAAAAPAGGGDRRRVPASRRRRCLAACQASRPPDSCRTELVSAGRSRLPADERSHPPPPPPPQTRLPTRAPSPLPAARRRLPRPRTPRATSMCACSSATAASR